MKPIPSSFGHLPSDATDGLYHIKNCCAVHLICTKWQDQFPSIKINSFSKALFLLTFSTVARSEDLELNRRFQSSLRILEPFH